MSAEDESAERKEIWVLKNEVSRLKEMNAQLTQRLEQYMEWTNQAQKHIEEMTNRTQLLENQNKQLYSELQAARQSDKHQLLEENARLKRDVREASEFVKTLNALMDPLVIASLGRMDPILKKKIKMAFASGTNERKILSLLLDEPTLELSAEYASDQLRLSQDVTRQALENLDSRDLLRQVGQGRYKIPQEAGDVMLSAKDASKVSVEALVDYIIEEVKKGTTKDEYSKSLDLLHDELKRRQEPLHAAKIRHLNGQLYMSNVSGDWLVEKLVEFRGRVVTAVEVEENVPTPVQTTQASPQASITHDPPATQHPSPQVTQPSHVQAVNEEQAPSPKHSPYSGLLSSPSERQDASKAVTSGATSASVTSIKTNHWRGLEPKQVLEDCRKQIQEISDLNLAIQLLEALRDHLSEHFSGRLLYKVRQSVTHVKKSRSLDKAYIYESMDEWAKMMDW